MEMAKAATNPAAFQHPLFAALIGQAIRDAPEDEFHFRWTRRELIKHYLDSTRRKFWNSSDGDQSSDEIALWAAVCVTAATLQRGAEFDVLDRHLPQSFSRGKTYLQPKKLVVQLAARITSSNNGSELSPFEPDILGDVFFLDFLKTLESQRNAYDTLIHILTDQDQDRNEEQRASSLLEVIDRLGRNLGNENPAEEYVASGWLHLRRFLNPSHFPKGSLIRVAVSLAIIRLVLAVPSEHRPVMKTAEFTAQIDVDDLLCALDGPNRIEAAEGLLIAFDCFDRSRDTAKEFKKVFPVFCQRVGTWVPKKWSPMVLAGYLGTKNTAEYILATRWWNHKKDLQSLAVGASAIGHLDLLEWALDGRIDVDFEEPGLRMTSLAVACANGHVDIARALIRQKANPDLGSGKDGVTPLMLATKGDYQELVRLLITAGADPDKQTSSDGWTPLMFAAVFNSSNSAKILAKHANLDKRSYRNGMTALMGAAEGGSLEVAEILVEAGANLKMGRLDNNTTALMEAVIGNNINVVQLLLDYDCGVDIQSTNSGMTALHIAAYLGRDDCYNLLLDKGARQDIITSEGYSVEDLAAFRRQNELFASMGWDVVRY